jgi:uncharacterized protein DUF4399
VTALRCATGFRVSLQAALVAGLLAGGAAAQAPRPTVTLIYPTEGAIVRAGALKVIMGVKGSTLKVADGSHDPRTGHFHLYLDKVPEPNIPIPQGVAGIWHTAVATFAIPEVSPGVHTLILVWANGDHFPFSPWVSDTIMFEAK